MNATFVADVLKMTDGQWKALDNLVAHHLSGVSDSMPGVISTGWVTPDATTDDDYHALLVRAYAEMRYLEWQQQPEYRITDAGLKLFKWRFDLKETLFKEWLDRQRG